MGITIDRATKYTSGGHLITRLPSADDIVPITTGDVIVITQRVTLKGEERYCIGCWYIRSEIVYSIKGIHYIIVILYIIDL